MKLYGMVAIILFIFLLCNIQSGYADSKRFKFPPSDRQKINIDKNWQFINRDFPAEEETHQVNELPWQSVDLPHDWTIEGPHSIENNTTQGFLPMGIGWYKKGLRFPTSYSDKKIFIIFDGVYRNSDVWMNYAHLGHHESGYTSFIFDITDYVRTGNRIPNGLRVRVDGRRHEQDMYEGNGIYRHVWLLVTNKLHAAYWGTFVSTLEVSDSEATIKIQTAVKNENVVPVKGELITQIVDQEGCIVAEINSSHNFEPNEEYNYVQQAVINSPYLWDIENPYLYKAYHIIKNNGTILDVSETSFGIRTFYFDPNNGFFLNGRHVKLKGFNAHHDFAGLGTALPDRIHWNVMTVMKKAGFNFYRSSHNPATPERLDVCDQIGMLVWDEIERKLESMPVELELMKQTITRDRNHPSIILWSLENESPLESTSFGTQIMKAATELAHELDPTRPTTFAASMPVNQNGYGDAVDVVSYNYHWKRADQDHIDFPEWKIGLLSEYSAARSRRGIYGVEHFQRAENDSYFDLYNGMVQSMYQVCSRVEEYWRRIKARDYLGGGCLWSGMDAWGEGNAWPLISRGDGALDLCLFPKDVYYYFVSQWIDKPMVHLFPHWNWEGKENQLIDVWCYTNCDSAELFLNDRSMGYQTRAPEPEPWQNKESTDLSVEKSQAYPEHLVWQVPYEPGTLNVVGKKDGKNVCEKKIKTAGKASKILLTRLMADFMHIDAIPRLQADGRDIIVLKASILDKDDNMVPTAENKIAFQVEGPGKIIGVGNGNIVSHESNKETHRKAYNGLCAVIVQSTNDAGDINIKAISSGLKSGMTIVRSESPKPVQILLDAKPYYLSRQDSFLVSAKIQDKYGSTILSAEMQVTFIIKGPAHFENGKKTISISSQGGGGNVRIICDGKKEELSVTAFAEEIKPGRIIFCQN